MTEHKHQVLFFKTLSLQEKQDPRLKNVFAVPNGGKRNVVNGRRMKAEGLKSGVPDIVVAIPIEPFHGMFIEMKNKTIDGKKAGRTSANQEDWLERLSTAGYATTVAYGFDEAYDALLTYLEAKWQNK